MKYLMVSLGGMLGANARLLLGEWVAGKLGPGKSGVLAFPWGTFLINVSGSFVLGLFMTLHSQRQWPDTWRLLIAVGFLGAYTTFSTFEYDSIRLLFNHQAAAGIGNLAGSVLAGLLGVALGILVGNQFKL